jgi:DivIVA domain-containing protein
MPLTPAQVRGLTFSTPPIGKRGYHQDEVDAFLELVAAELARLLDDSTALCTQLAQDDPQPGPGAIDTAAASSEPTSLPLSQPPPAAEEDYHHHAANVLHLAQRTAERVTSQAQADADALLHQARAHAEQLLREARARAESLISEATTRMQTVLHDARSRAEAVGQQSRDKLNQLASQQQEQLHQHTEIITALGAEDAALENRINQLHIFEDDHDTRVMRFLHAQLHQLSAQERPADPSSAPQTPVALVESGAPPATSPPWSSPSHHRWAPAVGA